MQPWLNTSSPVSQTRAAWHDGLHPSSKPTTRELSRGPSALLPNTPNPQVYRLSCQWCLSFVLNTTHRANHCSLLAHNHTDIPFIIPSFHAPAPALGPSLSWTPTAQKQAWPTTQIPAFRGEKQEPPFFHSLSPTQTRVRHERRWKQISLFLGYFCRKFKYEQEKKRKGVQGRGKYK